MANLKHSFNFERARVLVIEPHTTGMKIIGQLVQAFGVRDPVRCGTVAEAAKALAGGGAKSALVDVHPAMGHGPFPSNADFVAKYGGPRDHAAEQRGFNSGKRDINRLKRQGK